VSGKQAKRERRREKEAAREAARRKQRQQTMFTMIVIGIIVAIGGFLVFLSIEREEPVAEPTPTAEPTPGDTPATPEPDERPVACGAEAPPLADIDKPAFLDGPGQVIEAGNDYRAVIETSCGTVVIDLDQERAPDTVNSFVFLAQQGFFDGLEIFRNAPGIGALQTGAGTNEATWDVGYTLTDELEAAEVDGYPPGAVAMANRGPDTSGSQFFFVYNENFTLPPTYTRFGLVVEGLDVLEQIGAIPTGGPAGETPEERVFMNSVTIEIVGEGDGGQEATPTPEATATEPEATPTPTPTD
jgi:peptidyl-prolyl cis-trans isomerase B (cyclophilin B)